MRVERTVTDEPLTGSVVCKIVYHYYCYYFVLWGVLTTDHSYLTINQEWTGILYSSHFSSSQAWGPTLRGGYWSVETYFFRYSRYSNHITAWLETLILVMILNGFRHTLLLVDVVNKTLTRYEKYSKLN
jgi:hypothetical protein